jgi:glycosyltransferase involved in cell wall biosynthesis
MTALPIEAATVAERGARGLSGIELVGHGMNLPPRLSVVVPAYREGAAIVDNLARLVEALDGTPLSWEVIVVVDGDRDTYFAALPCRGARVQVHGYDSNRGKGFALRYGMSLARGELVTFIDSDMEISPEEIGRMATLLDLYDADVVVGSKRHPLSEVQYPRLRRIQSAGYQLLVRTLFRVRVRDTQTGLKMMRREVASRVLGAALVKRFAFDLELLALARHFGFRRIIEAPVRITYAFASTTNLRAVFWVLLDTLAIWYRLRLRRSYDRADAGMAALLAALPMILGAE